MKATQNIKSYTLSQGGCVNRFHLLLINQPVQVSELLARKDAVSGYAAFHFPKMSKTFICPSFCDFWWRFHVF